MKNLKPEGAAGIAKGAFGLGQERPVMILDQAHARDDAAVHFDMHYELEMGLIIEGAMERYTRDSSRVCRAGEIRRES